MKKLIRRVMAVAAICALGFTLAGCAPDIPTDGNGGEASSWQDNMHREENDFLSDDNARPSREPFVDNTPEDDGTPTAYRFEAEAAKIRGVSNGEDHFCTAKSTEFSPDFSGNITLCNLGTATLSFTFTSDKAVRSKMLIRMSNQYGSSTGGVLSAYADLRVNDRPVVDLSAAFDIESGEVASGSSESYFKMVTLETKISLAEGKNVLSITPATANYLNLDYVEIHSSAAIEDKTEPSITNPSAFVSVVKKPTQTAEGQISFVCHNKLSDGVEIKCDRDYARTRKLPSLTSEIYALKEFENGTQQTVKMFGGEAVIVSTVVYNLTLSGATFADGSTSGKFAPSEKPRLAYTTPEGKVFSHWEDSDGNNLGSVFVMPEKDITIKPVFVVLDNAVTVTLQGATLGGKNVVKALAGGNIDLSTAEFGAKPEGTVVRYWYNVADATEYYENYDNFTVPANDITLAPAFDKEVYANRDGSTVGKVATFPYYKYAEMIPGGSTQPVDGYVRLLEESGVKGGNAYWGFVGTGDGREMGAIYHWKAATEGGTLSNGFYFTALSPYKVTSGMKYTMSYTVQNQGAEEITLKIYQTNSSGSPKPSATATGQFTLAAGETKTVSVAFTGFNNNNILTTVELLANGISDLKLGMYQYIATAMYDLTLENAEFAGGGTTQKLAPGASPELTYTVPEGKTLKGWFDISDATKLYPVTLTVPEGETLTLAPVFDSNKAFYADKTNYEGKVAATGNLFAGKEKGCYAVIENKTTGAVNSGDGYYEAGSIYRFKGGTAAAPAQMAVGSHFLTQEMNGWHGNVDNLPKHTVTTTVENFGSEDVTLRFALIKSSSNPDSQYGETTVTIKAGESVTFTFDITYLHGSFMLDVMVKDKAVDEVFIGVYQYVAKAAE